ncbi:MAG TPA: outer membrane beta-barrel protein, partial [Segetibacter sp.]
DPIVIYSSQLRKRETSNLSTSLNASFNEPLSKTTSLRLSNNVEFNRESNYLSPFNKNSTSGKYVDLIDSINSGIERDLWRNTTTAGLTWRKKKFTVQGALNLLALNYNNDYLKSSPVNRSYTYVYPNISIDYNGIRLGYSANVRAPSAYELQPIIDNTNRQFLQYGNPTLEPVYSQSLSFNVFKSKPTGSSYSVFMNGSVTDNAVIRENTVNSAGIQTSRPVNVNGLKGGNASGSYTKQYKFNKNYRLSLRPSVFGSYNESIVSFNGNRSGSHTVGYNSSLNVGFNYKDKIELNNRYSYNKRFTRYDNTKFYRNIDVTTHSAESEVVIRLPKHFVWENLINYSYNSQVAPGIKKSVVRWNAGVNYLFLKQEKGNLKLSVFDLLNQNISVSRYTTENSIFDSQTTTLRRYFMLSFIYNLRTFSPGKVGGKDRSFFLF